MSKNVGSLTAHNDIATSAGQETNQTKLRGTVVITVYSLYPQVISCIMHLASDRICGLNCGLHPHSGKKKYVNLLVIPGFLHKLVIKFDLIFIHWEWLPLTLLQGLSHWLTGALPCRP